MTTIPEGAPDGADRRARIESLLAQYPDLAGDQLGELLHWFRKEASALDVALVASNPAITEGYRRFRADHMDRLTGRDIVRGVLFAAAVSLLVMVLFWQAF